VSAATAATCPRCGAVVDGAQEYCLGCGLRQPGVERLGGLPTDLRALRLRVGVLGLVACAGAALAIALAWEGPAGERVRTATGGSVTAPTPVVEPVSQLAVWPRTQRGWTIVLVSVPKSEGRDEAVAVAQQARTRRLTRVGVLDSSRFASLQPGYWMTFSGRYQSEAAATGSLRRARVAVKGARVVQIEP
jgi:hypothetical protein